MPGRLLCTAQTQLGPHLCLCRSQAQPTWGSPKAENGPFPCTIYWKEAQWPQGSLGSQAKVPCRLPRRAGDIRAHGTQAVKQHHHWQPCLWRWHLFFRWGGTVYSKGERSVSFNDLYLVGVTTAHGVPSLTCFTLSDLLSLHVECSGQASSILPKRQPHVSHGRSPAKVPQLTEELAGCGLTLVHCLI